MESMIRSIASITDGIVSGVMEHAAYLDKNIKEDSNFYPEDAALSQVLTYEHGVYSYRGNAADLEDQNLRKIVGSPNAETFCITKWPQIAEFMKLVYADATRGRGLVHPVRKQIARYAKIVKELYGETPTKGSCVYAVSFRPTMYDMCSVTKCTYDGFIADQNGQPIVHRCVDYFGQVVFESITRRYIFNSYETANMVANMFRSLVVNNKRGVLENEG